MKKKGPLLQQFLSVLMLTIITGNVSSQCDVKTKIGIDGTMYYYVNSVQFYSSSERQLTGTIVTDKENYFITLEPRPFPERKIAEKLKDPLEVTLSNSKQYKLEYFYSRYFKEDTLFRMMFLIAKTDLDDFRNNDVESISINMGETNGTRIYVFRLHKSALRENLACFIKDKKKDD